MKKGLLITVVVVAVILATILGVAGYFGAFRGVVIEEKEFGPVWLVYENHTGAYRNIKHPMDRVYKQLLDQEEIECAQGFGLYWDDPREVPEDKLRSIGGCILDAPDEETLARILARYQAAEFPSSKAAVAEFPLKGALSFLVAILKVYPELEKYMADNSLPKVPVMEVYDKSRGVILFVVAHQVSTRRFDSYLGEQDQKRAEAPEPAEQATP